MQRPLPFSHLSAPLHKVRGISVVIALLVLSAIMLAATALIRSADSAGLIARNYAFQRNATNAVEAALVAARNAGNAANIFLPSSPAPGVAANSGTNLAPFYFANAQALDARGIPAALLPMTPAVGTLTLPGNNSGFFIIERLCEFATLATWTDNNCQAFFPSGGSGGKAYVSNTAKGSYGGSATLDEGRVLFRITVRVDAGPGNRVFGQTIIANDLPDDFAG